MSTYDFRAIIAEVNLRARARPVGELQEIRKKLKGLSRLPGQDIFSKRTTFDEWAYHLGGLAELQFNIGVEDLHDGDMPMLRSGVAFSFQPNRSLPDIRVLYPKVWLFNDFIELNPEVYADMRMWHWTKKAGRSDPHMPRAIPLELMTEGVFVFLGKRQRLPKVDYEAILNDLDKLLPLYKYVESEGQD